jgi:hypothetical protein
MSKEIIKEFLVAVGIEVDPKTMSAFSSGLFQIAKGCAIVASAVSVAAGGIFLFTKGIANELDDLNDLSNRLNSTAGEIKEIGYIAQISGSSVDTASSSLEGLNKAAGDTILGLGRAKQIFAQIGVSVKGQDGKLKNTTQLIWEVGDAIKGMEIGKQTAILERLGIDKTMLATLTTDVTKLRDEFGSMYDKDEINQAAKDAAVFMDSFDKIRIKLRSVAINVAAKFFVPFINGMDKLTFFVNKYSKQVISFFSPFLDLIFRLYRAFSTLFGRIFSLAFSAFSTFFGWISTINSAMGGWLGKIALAVIAWRVLNATFLASPLGIIALLGLAILALLDDFLTWKEGGDSLFDWSDWSPFFTFMGSAIDGLMATLRLFFDLLFETFGLANDLLHLNFSGAGQKIGMMGDSVNHWAKQTGAQSSIGTRYGLAQSSSTKTREGAQSSSTKTREGAQSSSTKTREGAQSTIDPKYRITPSPSTQSSIVSNTSVNQKTEININGAGSPAEVGKVVAGSQSRTNDNMLRNMKGSAR